MLCWPRGPSSRGRMLSPGNNNESIELGVKTTIKTLWAPHTFASKSKKGDTCWWGSLILSTKENLVYHSAMEVRKSLSGIKEIIGHLLVLLCPVIKVNGKWQQPSLGRSMNGLDSSGTKIWATLPVKNPCLLREDAIQNGKKVVINISCDHVNSYRNQDCNCPEYFLFCYEHICVLLKQIYLFYSLSSTSDMLTLQYSI